MAEVVVIGLNLWISRLFGVVSMLILIFSVFIGVAVPLWITEGALGTPIVKSKVTEACIKSGKIEHILDLLNRETRADEIFALCRDELNTGCDSPYWLWDPQITKTRPSKCPFNGGICLNNTPSFQINHWNISAFEMGVNSRSKLTMNHRLTCTPVSLDSFLWKYDNGSFVFIQKPDSSSMNLYPNISLVLSTLNGPNKFSNEPSGIRMFEENGPWDLTILPRYDAGINYYNNPEPLELNEHLQSNDSQTFLVIHRAGVASCSVKVEDPFFSAHNEANIFRDSTISYIADYEATALGCVEQLQYCFQPSSPPMYCTDWGARSQQHSEMVNYLSAHYDGAYDGRIYSFLEHSNDQDIISLNEMLNLFGLFQSRFGVYDYIASRINYHKMVPLTRRKSIAEDSRWIENDPEQWVMEVETWFMKVYLSGILGIQDGALYALKDMSQSFIPAYIREWKLCGRVLFHNGSFTNIKWVGFCITNISLALVILVGSQVKTIHRLLKSFAEGLPKWTNRTISTLKRLPGHSRQLRRRMRRPARQPSGEWNFTSLFHPLSRYRLRRSSEGSREPNTTSNTTEMEDLEVPSSVQVSLDNDPTMQEGIDVDNPV